MSTIDPPAEIVYRQMTIDDHPALIELWRRSDGVGLRDADSRDGIDRYLQRNPGLSFVAVAADGVIGSIMGGHDGKRGYIQHLAVDAGFRQRGIGGALLRRCIDSLAAIGIFKSHVHVLQHNVGGVEFWRNRGWIHRHEIEMFSFVNSDNPNV